jgi:hypothetical protein
MFYVLKGIYNYADDNTLVRNGPDVLFVKSQLESATIHTIKWFVDNQMQVNPDKFQAILLCPGRKTASTSFTILNHEIIPMSTVKLLGIEIDDKLTFDKYISKVCKKAGFHLKALGRLSKSLSGKSKTLLFNSFVISHFQYCSLVWHNTSKKNKDMIENIQKRGLRLVLNDKTSDYKSLLEKARRVPLYVERLRKILLFVFKCLHGHSPEFLHDMFALKQQPHYLRNINVLNKPKVLTTMCGLKSLKYVGACLWNDIPNALKCINDERIFKELLNNWISPSCKCGSCILCEL